jgi:hypothetical protein
MASARRSSMCVTIREADEGMAFCLSGLIR